MECTRCQRDIHPLARVCTHCGAKVPPAQHLLAESGVDEPEDDDVLETDSAAGHKISTGNSRSVRVARLGDRALAAMLDSTALIAAFVTLNTWALMRWGMSTENECHITLAVVLFAMIWDALICFTYFWVAEMFFGATAGKAITGIAVINQSERKDIAASAIRNGLRFVDGHGFYLLGALVASCSKTRRRVGDIVAKTVVVEKDLSLAKRAAGLAVWLVVVLGAATVLFSMWSRDNVPTQRPAHFGRVIATAGHTLETDYLNFSSTHLEFRVSQGVRQSVPANANAPANPSMPTTPSAPANPSAPAIPNVTASPNLPAASSAAGSQEAMSAK